MNARLSSSQQQPYSPATPSHGVLQGVHARALAENAHVSSELQYAKYRVFKENVDIAEQVAIKRARKHGENHELG